MAYSRLVAFGLSKQAIAQTLTISPEKLGEYTLFAQTSGAVLTDNFAQGQRVDSGIELMLIADESALWVVAQLSANQDRTISNGSTALLEVTAIAIKQGLFKKHIPLMNKHVHEPLGSR